MEYSEREIIEERYPRLIHKGAWSDIKIEVRVRASSHPRR